ncbi:exported hypothetical protein [Candidatus Sulfopaludibacter sp. SbA3]|nr:exported hypothetical protein [Candidatus Sulfopaludibacter sp. SbA3]
MTRRELIGAAVTATAASAAVPAASQTTVGVTIDCYQFGRRRQRAYPIAEKYRHPLELENHKDWTADELTALLTQYGSEYLGVCLDTGNTLSLLDDYMEVVELLAPFSNRRRIVSTVRSARKDAHFTLEMITRDPLKVPVLTDRYWATFPDRNGRDLTRTLATGRANAPRNPLPEMATLDRDSRIRLEEDNVRECLAYAAAELGMAARL